MTSKHTFQSPKGTRDFDPISFAQRKYIFDAWRVAAINAGYLEIDGPTFEHLDLYVHKSGEGIVSELFSFTRQGGERQYALRPEFTPTLARMAASKGRSLEIPTRWFSMPAHFRAERPQRGRLREFYQFNVDLLGDSSLGADAEVISVAIDALKNIGFTSNDLVVRLSHREVAASIVKSLFNSSLDMQKLFNVLDKRPKTSEENFLLQIKELGIDHQAFISLDEISQHTFSIDSDMAEISDRWKINQIELSPLAELARFLKLYKISDWVEFDLSIVRGLAYYTGAVFEVHDRKGKTRAVAGGGRYDNLVKSFGGPNVPACGFGMGDVVLDGLIKNKNLYPENKKLLPVPVAYVFGINEEGRDQVISVLAMLRGFNIHARSTGRSTTNIGKLVSEASRQGAIFAVILDGSDELDVKVMETGEQTRISLRQVVNFLKKHTE